MISIRQNLAKSSFNPRLRGGGDLKCWCRYWGANCFNPRLRGGGDIGLECVPLLYNGFNPRLRGGGDLTVCRREAQVVNYENEQKIQHAGL